MGVFFLVKFVGVQLQKPNNKMEPPTGKLYWMQPIKNKLQLKACHINTNDAY